MQIAKPPYNVPSMTEIASLQWNGFNVVSTFSGCGGSCLGYRMAGFRVLWANEFIPEAQRTYKANHPDSILDTRDIRTVQPGDILKAVGLQEGELDLFDGSPPCASFSTAGKREAGWGKVKQYSDTKQRTDDLFFEYARLVKGLQPKVFVAENVSGLVKGTAKGYFKEILAALKACGYRVEAKLLDAQWLGVPQMRQRLIFMGVRNDLKLAPVFPKPLPYRYSVRDALPWIEQHSSNESYVQTWRDESRHVSPTVTATINEKIHQVKALRIEVEEANGHKSAGQGIGHVWTDVSNVPMPTIQASRPVKLRAYRDKRGAFGNEGDITDKPAPTVLSDSVGTHWIEEESDISRYAIGKEWDKLTSPCPTVTQRGGDNTVASVTHPTEKRKFTIAELKRICAFPDDFILTGSYAQQWERLGRAVPPVMMAAIAATVRDEILCKLN